MNCHWCNQPIRGRKEKVGNASLHPDCLDELVELTEPMFRQKLGFEEVHAKQRNTHGSRRRKQDNSRTTRGDSDA